MLNIKNIREEKKLTQDEIVALLDISKRSYVAYENGKTDIPLSKLQDIARVLNVALGDLVLETKSKENATLLKGGENGGENGGNPKVKNLPPFPEKEKGERMLPVPLGSGLGVPLIPIDAMAGFGAGETTVLDYETSRYMVPEFEELHVDFMISVKGSSMYPKYNSGDIVACKKLSLNDIFFQWNKVYVLDTTQGALIKRIKKGSDKDHILLVSDNLSYDPFEIHLNKIRAISLVIGVIRLE